jgi:hypothetical protein
MTYRDALTASQELISESTTVQAGRMLRFLNRQHLWDKFLAEDAAGKR